MSDYPSTQKEAKINNTLFYFTGLPCKYGHVTPRRTKNAACVGCDQRINDLTADYRKDHYSNNKDKITQRSIEWQQNNKESHNKSVASYYQKNKRSGSLLHIQRNMINRTKARAKKHNIAFNLTLEYIQEIWPADNKCPVFLTEFDLNAINLQHCASCDKINPELGYIQGNIDIISFRANSLKSNGTICEFRTLLIYLENNQALHV